MCRKNEDNFFISRKDEDNFFISRKDEDNFFISRKDDDNFFMSRKNEDNVAELANLWQLEDSEPLFQAVMFLFHFKFLCVSP